MFLSLFRLKKHRSQNLKFFFQTAPHIYRTNYGLNKLKKHGSKNACSFFFKRRICPIYKSEIPDLFCMCFLVRFRAQFGRYISRIFSIYSRGKSGVKSLLGVKRLWSLLANVLDIITSYYPPVNMSTCAACRCVWIERKKNW